MHHPHSHSHHHSPHSGASFTEDNRKYWDEHATNYSAEQWQKDFITKTSAFIHANIPLIDSELVNSTRDRAYRVLDYACGPGTLTNALGSSSRAGEFVGMDLSPNMVALYNKRFAGSGDDSSPALSAHAMVGNLLDDHLPPAMTTPELADFDLAVVGYAFHHFADPAHAAQRLVERLKPGGVLAIVDLVAHEEEQSPGVHIVAHHGFSEGPVREMFAAAGLVDVQLVVMGETVEVGKMAAKRVFLARGRKA